MATFIIVTALFLVFLITGQSVLSFLRLCDPEKQERYVQIDGLRGILAFGVMMFHFLCIRQVVVSGKWDTSAYSSVVNLLGFHTVYLFFGLTGFLFMNKMIYSQQEFNAKFWIVFYVGRLFRLVPVAFTCGSFLLLAFAEEFIGVVNHHGEYRSFLLAILHIVTSSLFSKAHDPQVIGKIDYSWTIAAGPNWSLHYEWIFYLSLPVIAFICRQRTSLVLVTISVLVLLYIDGSPAFFFNWGNYTWAFIPGVICSLLQSYIRRVPTFAHPLFGVISVGLFIATSVFNRPKYIFPAECMFLAAIIAGNKITSVLSTKLFRSLGDTTYSIYLLHGIVQYVSLRYLVTMEIARSMSEMMWWGFCGIQVVTIVVVSRFSYEFVEKPGINLGQRVNRWLMSKCIQH